MYHILAHQPSEGLTKLGQAAVRAMFCNGILIDVTHMSERAITDTLDLLAQLEAEYAVTTPVPVLATHIACRFGTSEYNLSAATITEIGKRNGLMGVIFCDHWMHDGPSKHDPRGERETFEMVKRTSIGSQASSTRSKSRRSLATSARRSGPILTASSSPCSVASRTWQVCRTSRTG